MSSVNQAFEVPAWAEGGNPGHDSSPNPMERPNNDNGDYGTLMSNQKAKGFLEAAATLSPEATISTPIKELDIEEAMERLGMGRFQFQILVAAGLCFAADAMEVLLLSFLSVILTVEWGLQGHQTDLLISVVFLGAMIGTLILSPLGDRLGRRPVFSLTAAIIAIFGIGTGFCSNYAFLLVCRFMVGFGVGGLVVPFDTLAEFLPTEYRGPNLLYIEFFWTFGTLLVPVCAWLTLGDGQEDAGSWSLFCILCAIPCCFATGLGVIMVPESPRWLLTKGKQEEALFILRDAAQTNGLDPMSTFPHGTRLTQQDEEHDSSLADLFAPKWLRKTILLWIAWFGLAFLYYGAILAVSIVFTDLDMQDNENDGDDDNQNIGSYQFDYPAIFISASSEFVGLLLVLATIDRYGRIPTQTFTYILGGVSCLALGYAAHFEASRAILVTLSFIARLAMMGATCTTWVSTSEILTTDIRTTGHGYANAMSRIGGFFCPYIISERNSLNHIGMFLFVVSCVAAVTVWQLPETSPQVIGRKELKEPLHPSSDSPTKIFNTDRTMELS